MPKKINEITYDRRIFEQLEETITKIEKMSVEIADLKKAHRQEMYLLGEKHELGIKKLKATQKAEVGELKERISIQAAEIEQLKEENAALKEIMNKNSGNSSKAPSSDGFIGLAPPILKYTTVGREQERKRADKWDTRDKYRNFMPIQQK